MTLNLTATNRQEEIIKEYLENNASETLAEKINNGIKTEKDGKSLISKKNLNGFFKYATEEARKLAEKGATSAMVEDKVVFGWAMHYFEEDSILGTLYNEDGTEYKPVVKKTTKPTVTTTPTPYVPPVKKPEPQMSLFDMLAPKEEHKPVIKDDKPTLSYKAQLATQSQPDPLDDEPSEEDVQEAFEELNNIVEKQEETKPVSPIYKTYSDTQKQYPNSIIAYRLGDFYEVFGDGATKISDPLDLTLTGRDFGLKERIAMVGFPYHCADKYFKQITGIAELIVLDGKDITVYDKLSNSYSVDMETGEIITNEYENEIIKSLKNIFGDNLEVRL